MDLRVKSTRGLIYWQAFMAGLTSLAGAGVVSDVIGLRATGALFALVSALQAGTAAYLAATRPVESIPPDPDDLG